jgi:hypothetical protein
MVPGGRIGGMVKGGKGKGGGNSHQRAVSRAAQAPTIVLSSVVATAEMLPTGRSFFERASVFFENGIILTIMSILGGLAGTFVNGRYFLFLCVPIALGLHRSSALNGVTKKGKISIHLLVLCASAVLLWNFGRWWDSSRRSVAIPQSNTIGGMSDAEQEAFAQKFAARVAGILKTWGMGGANLPSAEGSAPESTSYVPDSPPLGEGFVQLESGKSIYVLNLAEMDTIDEWYTGRVIRVNFSYANRGGTPVYNPRAWGSVVVAVPEKNQGNRMHELLAGMVKEAYQKGPGASDELGVDQSGNATAVGLPLTDTELGEIEHGTERIMLFTMGGWMDRHGKLYTWTDCEWTNWGDMSSGSKVLLSAAIWHNC